MSLSYLWLGTWQPSQCPPLFPGSGPGRSCQLFFLLPGELESSTLQAGDRRDQDLHPRGQENSPVLGSDNCAEGRARRGVGGKPSTPSCLCTAHIPGHSFRFYRQRGEMTPLGGQSNLAAKSTNLRARSPSRSSHIVTYFCQAWKVLRHPRSAVPPV